MPLRTPRPGFRSAGERRGGLPTSGGPDQVRWMVGLAALVEGVRISGQSRAAGAGGLQPRCERRVLQGWRQISMTILSRACRSWPRRGRTRSPALRSQALKSRFPRQRPVGNGPGGRSIRPVAGRARHGAPARLPERRIEAQSVLRAAAPGSTDAAAKQAFDPPPLGLRQDRPLNTPPLSIPDQTRLDQTRLRTKIAQRQTPRSPRSAIIRGFGSPFKTGAMFRPQLPVQQIVARLRVEALVAPILPRTAGLDEGGPTAAIHSRTSLAMTSGPSSERTWSAAPRRMKRFDRASITSADFSFRSTRIARRSRMNSTMTAAAGAASCRCGSHEV